MIRECDVLGQLDLGEHPLQTDVRVLEGSNCTYHENERLVEVTSGCVELYIPEGYALVCQQSTVAPRPHVYLRTSLCDRNKVYVSKGNFFGLVKLEPLNVVQTTYAKS